MYADDTTLYFMVEAFPKDDLRNCVTNELNKIHLWLQNNKLSLNAEKTKCITFHTRQKHINPILYSINGVEIENVDSFKFLGIFLTLKGPGIFTVFHVGANLNLQIGM